MRKRLFTLLLTAFIFVSQSRATTWIIQAVDNDFRPNVITLQLGDTVKWVWINGVHTTSSNGIPANAQPWNELLDSMHTSFSYPVLVAGSYDYISVLNVPLMSGVFMTPPVTGIDEASEIFSDVKAWWNASNEEVTVQFSTKQNANVQVELFNLNGQLLRSLSQTSFASTVVQQEIPCADLPRGYYVLTLSAGNSMIGEKSFWSNNFSLPFTLGRFSALQTFPYCLFYRWFEEYSVFRFW